MSAKDDTVRVRVRVNDFMRLVYIKRVIAAVHLLIS